MEIILFVLAVLGAGVVLVAVVASRRPPPDRYDSRERTWAPFARAMMAVELLTPEERDLFRSWLDERWPPPPAPPPNENITR